jgi:rSAM/selenodomain-associated transferase 1
VRRRGVLIVFARRPEPGRVKTRLSPPLLPEQAAELYAAMLADVLEASADMARRFDLDAWLAVTPPEACDELARSAPAGFRTVAQRGADLGKRMENAVADAFADGSSPVLVRGSDSPALGAGSVGAALDALAANDLVLLPDRDGGYGLVGLRAPADGLLAHPTSTPSVLAETVARAQALSLRVHLLEPGFDIDTVDDLRLLAEVRDRAAALCPRTLAYLDAKRLWPTAR